MKPMTKRIAKMTALYAAKKLWNRVDQEAARKMAGQLYRSTPRDWELAAKRAAGEGYESVRGQAVNNFDELLTQVGLLRRSQVPTRSTSSMMMGAIGGIALTAAGGYFLFGTDAGKKLRRTIEERLGQWADEMENEMESADHNMDGDTTIANPKAMDKPSETAHVRAPIEGTPPN